MAELTLAYRLDYKSYASAECIVERVLVHDGEYNEDSGRPGVLLACDAASGSQYPGIGCISCFRNYHDKPVGNQCQFSISVLVDSDMADSFSRGNASCDFVNGEHWIFTNFQPERYSTTVAICFVVCIVAVIASWSPWRVVGSYELPILGDSTGAMRWVGSQKRNGDEIAVTEHILTVLTSKVASVTTILPLPLLYDFAVMQNGVLVDRNGGGEVVSNVDQLIGEFSKAERIWILLNRENFRSRGKNMRREYPEARFEMFVRKNCELKHRTYLWSVFLWDPARGHYKPFRLQE